MFCARDVPVRRIDTTARSMRRTVDAGRLAFAHQENVIVRSCHAPAERWIGLAARESLNRLELRPFVTSVTSPRATARELRFF